MDNVMKVLAAAVGVLLLLACSDSENNLQRIDDPQLIATLQKQIDSIIEDGYLVDRIDIETKSFAKHGPDFVGDMEWMFVRAVPTKPGVEYWANFSYLPGINSLNFLGYPVSPSNQRKEKPYAGTPDLREALLHLEEIKALIPENYTYRTLFSFRYLTPDDGQGVYEFEVEVVPASKAASHPNVHCEEKAYNQFTVSRNSKRHIGGVREVHRNKLIQKEQCTIRFRLRNKEIEIL